MRHSLLFISIPLEPPWPQKIDGGFSEADGRTGDEEGQGWEDSLLCLSVCSVCLLLCSLQFVREFTPSRCHLFQAVKEQVRCRDFKTACGYFSKGFLRGLGWLFLIRVI